MADMPTQARVVIIGGGVVGVSALYHLARPAGPTAFFSKKRTDRWLHLACGGQRADLLDLLVDHEHAALFDRALPRGSARRSTTPMNYHVTGSIRLGHSEERMQEFARARGMGLYQGMNLEILAPDEIKDKYPFIETHDLKGALYDPADGDIDPAQLTQALAKGARDLGAKILRFCPATGVSRENDEWIIHTEKGDIRCEIVVNAAGYYAQRVGEWFKPFGGRTVPMMVMSHQYMMFDEVPAVATGRPRWATSCRSCAMSTCPTTSGRRRTASTSAPTNGPARPTGPTRPIRCPRISAFSFIPTRWSGCRSRSRIPWPACPCWPRRGWPRRSTARSPTRRTATR
jgi:dimethylglycine dehydrogenase